MPVNDQAWGKGFTEWDNVRRGEPQFPGHHQPRVPADFGYYDLRSPDVMASQTAAARRAGIDAFCFYYYWFDGEMPLIGPVRTFLDQRFEFGFTLCFANENWTKRWDGLDDEVILAQSYGEGFADRFWADIVPFLQHEDYLRDETGKPIVLIYRPSIIPDFEQVSMRWRELAVQDGLPGLTTIAGLGFEDPGNLTGGTDGFYEFPPLRTWAHTKIGKPGPKQHVFGQAPQSNCTVHDYRQYLLCERLADPQPDNIYPCVMPGWDNTARRRSGANIFDDSHPLLFRQWCEYATRRASETRHQLLFINAWNEWAEGAYLEPDTRYGWAHLNAFAHGVSRAATPSTGRSVDERPIAVFVHVFYLDVWQEIRTLLSQVLQRPFHLIVTTPHAAKAIETPDSPHLQHFQVIVCSNTGRDWKPFLQALKTCALAFEIGLKLHTKKSTHKDNGDIWRKLLLDGLCGSATKIERYIGALQAQPNIGLIAPDGHLIPLGEFIGSNRDTLAALLRERGFELTDRDLAQGRFVAGSMFWFQKDALAHAVGTEPAEEDFGEELGQLDGTLAHAYERLVAPLAEKTGFLCLTASQAARFGKNGFNSRTGLEALLAFFSGARNADARVTTDISFGPVRRHPLLGWIYPDFIRKRIREFYYRIQLRLTKSR